MHPPNQSLFAREVLMRSHILTAALMAAGLLAATPVLAQTTADASKSGMEKTAQQQAAGGSVDTIDPATGAKKQHTQGLPPNVSPQAYGSDWQRKQGQASKQQ
jgi:hypothetical protein